MEMNFGFGNTARILLTAVAVAVVSAPVFAGPKEDEAVAICSETLTAEYGAQELTKTRASQYKPQMYFAYATARRAGDETIRFRCFVRYGTVSTVTVYTPVNPGSANTRFTWTTADAYRLGHQAGAPAPVEATPEPAPEISEAPLEVEREFKAPGTGTGFKSAGAGTGFQAPGARSGFKAPGTGSGFQPAK
ncbi:MAG: hypothetical protein ACTSUD_08575 [Alphaproteobacteria bacterium]